MSLSDHIRSLLAHRSELLAPIPADMSDWIKDLILSHRANVRTVVEDIDRELNEARNLLNEWCSYGL